MPCPNWDVLTTNCLNSLERMLAEAFTLELAAEELRAELAARAEPLLEVVIETQLKGFLIHLDSEGT